MDRQHGTARHLGEFHDSRIELVPWAPWSVGSDSYEVSFVGRAFHLDECGRATPRARTSDWPDPKPPEERGDKLPILARAGERGATSLRKVTLEHVRHDKEPIVPEGAKQRLFGWLVGNAGAICNMDAER